LEYTETEVMNIISESGLKLVPTTEEQKEKLKNYGLPMYYNILSLVKITWVGVFIARHKAITGTSWKHMMTCNPWIMVPFHTLILHILLKLSASYVRFLGCPTK
jgi:hypothetical protein